jgi:hypothetical protein
VLALLKLFTFLKPLSVKFNLLFRLLLEISLYFGDWFMKFEIFAEEFKSLLFKASFVETI